MGKKRIGFLMVVCLLVSCLIGIQPSQAKAAGSVSAIFGGGPFVTGGEAVMNDLKSSGFNTVIIWSIHPHENGDLYINDLLVCKGGKFVGKQEWVDGWQSLKRGKTSVTRVEISVGAWGCGDFENIRALINRDGTGKDTILYRNFEALKNATGADAVNYDDESCYDVPSSVQFGKMCASMGMKVALCPYTNTYYWRGVKEKLGDIVDRVYLQCYAGGSGNNPASWKQALNMDIIPGLWCLNNGYQGDSASRVHSRMKGWRSSIEGGFMWLYDDMMKLSSPNATEDYASAINRVFTDRPTVPEQPQIGDNIAKNKKATANQSVSAETPNLAVDGSVEAYGYGNSKWCSTANGNKWLKLDLGKSYEISRWVVRHAGAGGESTEFNTKNFKLQKSMDGETWTDVDVVMNNRSSITDRKVDTFSARYVRLYITAPTQTKDNAARIYEFELYK